MLPGAQGAVRGRKLRRLRDPGRAPVRPGSHFTKRKGAGCRPKGECFHIHRLGQRLVLLQAAPTANGTAGDVQGHSKCCFSQAQEPE